MHLEEEEKLFNFRPITKVPERCSKIQEGKGGHGIWTMSKLEYILCNMTASLTLCASMRCSYTLRQAVRWSYKKEVSASLGSVCTETQYSMLCYECTVLGTVCTALCNECNVLCTVCTALCNVCTVLCIVCTALCNVCTVLCTVCTALCNVCTRVRRPYICLAMRCKSGENAIMTYTDPSHRGEI